MSGLRALGAGWLTPRLGLLVSSEMLMLFSIMSVKVALPWWIAENGGAKGLAIWAVVVAVGTGIGLVALSPAADRYGKAGLLSSGLVALAAHAAVVGCIADNGYYSVGAVVLLSLLEAAALAVILPSTFSLVPELVAASSLTKALALQKTAKTLGKALGPVSAAVVLSQAGIPQVLWAAAALFLCASALAALVHLPANQPGSASNGQSWMRETAAGIQVKLQIGLERRWSTVSFFIMLFLMPAIGILLPLKVQALGSSAAWLGIWEASLAGGMLSAALGGTAVLARLLGRFRASFSCIVCQGVAVALVGLASTPLSCAILLFPLGFSLATVDLVGQTHRLLATPPYFRGRMAAANLIIAQIAMSLGPAIAGIALTAVSVHFLYVGFGVALIVTGLAYLSIPGYIEFLNMPHDEAVGLYSRRHPHLFAPSNRP